MNQGVGVKGAKVFLWVGWIVLGTQIWMHAESVGDSSFCEGEGTTRK